MKIDPKCSTHLPVLKDIFDFRPIKSVFEFGCGLYSTKFFVDNAEQVYSVEMQSKRWFDKIKSEIASPKLSLSCFLDVKEVLQHFEDLNRNFDMVFVDGIEREQCINQSSQRSSIIVRHDVGGWFYRRYIKNLKISSDYKFIVYKKMKPYTGVFTSNNDLYDHLSNLWNNK